jgi:hypothetical protein
MMQPFWFAGPNFSIGKDGVVETTKGILLRMGHRKIACIILLHHAMMLHHGSF